MQAQVWSDYAGLALHALALGVIILVLGRLVRAALYWWGAE